MRSTRVLAAGALALLAACQPSPPTDSTAATAAPPAILPKPQASTIALMSGVIGPTSDAIWQAMPASDKDWADLRYKVLLMAEAANLLAVPDRPGLLAGEKLASPSGPGDLTPDESAAKIKAEWPTYLAYAQTLQNGALATLKAVDSKNADALVEAGGAIYEACEQCHKRFWYPNAPTPP
jgi:hypothetical protein